MFNTAPMIPNGVDDFIKSIVSPDTRLESVRDLTTPYLIDLQVPTDTMALMLMTLNPYIFPLPGRLKKDDVDHFYTEYINALYIKLSQETLIKGNCTIQRLRTTLIFQPINSPKEPVSVLQKLTEMAKEDNNIHLMEFFDSLAPKV